MADLQLFFTTAAIVVFPRELQDNWKTNCILSAVGGPFYSRLLQELYCHFYRECFSNNDTKSCQGFHRSLAIVLQCDKQIPLERKSLECNILRHCWLLALEVASVVVLFLLREIHCTNNSTSTAPPPTSSFVFKCLCNPKFEWRMLEYVLMYNQYFDDIVHRVCSVGIVLY